MALETTTASEDNPHKVVLDVSDGILEELDRIKRLTGFNTPTQFRKAYTLLRIVLDTYQKGGEVSVKTGDGEECFLKIPGYNTPE